MADETGISWCDSTFNPWVGCSKVSPGCAHCYAETWSNRYNRAVWGDTGTRVRTSPSTWAKPLRWEREHEAFEAEHGHRRRVFCASLADVFEPRPELEPWRGELFELIADTPSLDWLLLTKRPEEARDWFSRGDWMGLPSSAWLLPNVWVGTSIENSRFTWRADVLREIPAAVRFISAEPLLGSLFQPPSARRRDDADNERRLARSARDAEGRQRTDAAVPRGVGPLDLTGIDWVIVGGESGGPKARPMRPDWAREIRDACKGTYEDFRAAADPPPWGRGLPDFPGPAFHMKQWGSHNAEGQYCGPAPTAGGKLLDGVDWCEFPAALSLV